MAEDDYKKYMSKELADRFYTQLLNELNILQEHSQGDYQLGQEISMIRDRAQITRHELTKLRELTGLSPTNKMAFDASSHARSAYMTGLDDFLSYANKMPKDVATELYNVKELNREQLLKSLSLDKLKQKGIELGGIPGKNLNDQNEYKQLRDLAIKFKESQHPFLKGYIDYEAGQSPAQSLRQQQLKRILSKLPGLAGFGILGKLLGALDAPGMLDPKEVE